MAGDEVLDIGSRRELMVDDFLVERLRGARLQLHHPTPREVALETDRPWESNMSGGELLTKPLVFEGNRLELNVATSAAGNVRVEIQEADGEPIDGFRIDDCHEIIGDTLAYTARWRDRAGVRALECRPVRPRILMRDSDLYSLQFKPTP